MRTPSLLVVMLLMVLLAAPEASLALPAEPRFSARLTLLGLSVDLHGAYLDGQDWMLLVGKGGLIAYAERGQVWTYRLVSYGGSDLRSVIWSGSSGLVVGAGRAVLVEGARGSFTVRDVPFLRGDFAAAVWSLDGSFAVLMTSDGRVLGYRPGEGAAYEVRAPPVRILVASTVRFDGLSYVPVVAEERRDRNSVIRRVLFIDRDLNVHEAGDLLQQLLAVSIQQMLNRTLSRRPELVGTVLITPVTGSQSLLTSYQGNLIEVDDGAVVRRIALAFNVLGIYGRERTVVAVGEGGGIAVVDLDRMEVRYVSVPSSESVSFIDESTAVITSPRGLFVYSLSDGSVEHIPMSSRPTAFLPDGMLVADEGGRLYRLVRPAPWRGGLLLEAVIEDGYVSGMAAVREGVLLVVRKRGGSPEETRLMLLNSAGLRTLANATRMVRSAQLSHASPFGGTVLVTGAGAYLVSGDAAVRLWQEGRLGPPAWHPSGCTALVPGGSSTLLALLGDSLVRIPLEGSRDLLAAAWSHDGRYALVGGAGVLYAFDGASVREIEVPYVIAFRHIAARPGRDEFLASTSLGLIMVRVSASFGRLLEVLSHDSRVIAGRDGPSAVLSLYAVAHEPIRVSSLSASSDRLYLLSWSCPHQFTAELAVPRGGQVAGGPTAVQLWLDTSRGQIDLGSYTVSVPLTPSGGDAVLSWLTIAAVVSALSVGAILVLRRLMRRRAAAKLGAPEALGTGEREEGDSGATEAEEARGTSERRGEEGYYGGDERW
ncbi:MAG: hypothetical protein QXP81_10585 [Nitrososphaerota archaeon]